MAEELKEKDCLGGIKRALAMRPVKPNESVLELGCNNRILKRFLPKESKYVGVDYFNKAADVKHNLNRFPYPFENNSFDVIFCLQTLEHLENPFRALGEMKRISKNDIVLGIPNVFHWRDIAINFLKKYTKQWYGSHLFSFTWQNVDGLANRLSLKITNFDNYFIFMREKTLLLKKSKEAEKK